MEIREKMWMGPLGERGFIVREGLLLEFLRDGGNGNQGGENFINLPDRKGRGGWAREGGRMGDRPGFSEI